MGWLLLAKTTIGFSRDRKVTLSESTRVILLISVIVALVPLLHASLTHVNSLPFLQLLLPHVGESVKSLSYNLVFGFPRVLEHEVNRRFPTVCSTGLCLIVFLS